MEISDLNTIVNRIKQKLSNWDTKDVNVVHELLADWDQAAYEHDPKTYRQNLKGIPEFLKERKIPTCPIPEDVAHVVWVIDQQDFCLTDPYGDYVEHLFTVRQDLDFFTAPNE